MTQPQAVTAETCDQSLRQGREFLAQGDLASASAAGWRAALRALEAYAGDAVAECDFKDVARALVKDSRGSAKAAEWVVSAITLSENVADDWLDADGVARRLDDAQRLALLVKDIAEPPQSAEDILGRAWECMDNGYLIPASDKGWEAALLAAKTYADAIGYQYSEESHFHKVMNILEKEEAGNKEIGTWVYVAAKLRQTAAYCNGRNDPRYAELVADDISDVGKLASLIQALTSSGNSQAV